MKPKLLILRQIGGIGDALCCTPPLQRFVQTRQSDFNITIAFPKFCLPIFKGVVNVVDKDTVDPDLFTDVIRLSGPCPASVYEGHHRENVRLSRIQIFAKALRLNPEEFKSEVPIYNYYPEREYVTSIAKRKKGFTVGISLHSNEAYRDYIHTAELIDLITNYTGVKQVFLYGQRLPEGYKANSKHSLFINKELRKAISSQTLCNVMITPDTLFLHTAAALHVPTILLEGPLSNDYRFASYPLIRVSARKDCIPCWRNGNTPCKYAPLSLPTSVCMDEIKLGAIENALKYYDQADKIFNTR